MLLRTLYLPDRVVCVSYFDVIRLEAEATFHKHEEAYYSRRSHVRASESERACACAKGIASNFFQHLPMKSRDSGFFAILCYSG